MIPFVVVLRVVGRSKSCRGVYQDWFMWIIQLGVHSKRWQMEADILNPLRPFWICWCAIWPFQHTCYLSKSNEQCILWIFEWFYGCYIDDILIFSKNIKDYNDDVHLVLEKLQEVELYAKLKKCDFHQSEMEFLRYVIFGDGIHMDLCKV